MLCLPITETLLGYQVGGLISGQLAVEPGLSSVDAYWSETHVSFITCSLLGAVRRGHALLTYVGQRPMESRGTPMGTQPVVAFPLGGGTENQGSGSEPVEGFAVHTLTAFHLYLSFRRGYQESHKTSCRESPYPLFSDDTL